jgi:hypothetical protein
MSKLRAQTHEVHEMILHNPSKHDKTNRTNKQTKQTDRLTGQTDKKYTNPTQRTRHEHERQQARDTDRKTDKHIASHPFPAWVLSKGEVPVRKTQNMPAIVYEMILRDPSKHDKTNKTGKQTEQTDRLTGQTDRQRVYQPHAKNTQRTHSEEVRRTNGTMHSNKSQEKNKQLSLTIPVSRKQADGKPDTGEKET